MFVSPEQNLVELGLHPGMIVADFGAGGGAYTLVAARLVEEAGKVYAIDIQKDLLDRIKAEAAAASLNNVEVIWGDIEVSGGTKLADGLADVVILSNVLTQVENVGSLISEVSRVLKPGGRVLLIDWSDASALKTLASKVVGESQARETFSNGGLDFVKNFSAGDHHYGLIFKKL